MSKTRFIGDIHGDFAAYLQIIENCEASVQVGDFGIGFGEAAPLVGAKHRFIRGNHDDPDMCKTMVSNWIPDGTVEGHVMYCGGAWSIDQQWRTPGYDWWFDEELNDEEFFKVAGDYKENLPKIMVTHDLPHGINQKIIPVQHHPYIETRTTHWFREMFDAHKPDLWIVGHHHPEKGIVEKVEGTTFIVLPINGWIDLEI